MMIDENTCHCGANMGGSDHCPRCGCEEYERDCGERSATHGDMYAAVGAEGGESALKLLGDLLEQDRRNTERLEEQIRIGIEQERDEWRERALQAEEQLDRIKTRIWGLVR